MCFHQMKALLFHTILPLTQIAHLAVWLLHQNSPQREIIQLEKNPFYFTYDAYMMVVASVPENRKQHNTIHTWKSLYAIYLFILNI